MEQEVLQSRTGGFEVWNGRFRSLGREVSKSAKDGFEGLQREVTKF